MKYFVVWPDGQKFGPADVATLNQWAAEGRITEATELESVDTGARAPAGTVPGMVFAGAAAAAQPVVQQPVMQQPVVEQPVMQQPVQPQASNPYGQPAATNPYGSTGAQGYQNPATNYQRAPSMAVGDDGGGDFTKALIFSIAGFLCCCFLLPVGIYFGNEAKKKGHPQGNTIFIVAIVLTVLYVLGTLAYFLFVAAVGASGASPTGF